MKKKIFVVSDVHGNYGALAKSLMEKGYEETKRNNLLIVCGDLFDRGRESLEVYTQLKRLSDEKKAIIVRGNHDDMFIDYLTGKCITPFNYYRNGTRETFADFMHQTAPFETWCIYKNIEIPTYLDFADWLEIARQQINEEYPELLPWLQKLPYYYETKNYIFTHGAIDTEIVDWHLGNWKKLVWDDGSFFNKPIENTNKTVVIGHFSTRHLREKYNINDNGGDDILYRDDNKVIAIDTCTILTNKVNVLVVKDEL